MLEHLMANDMIQEITAMPGQTIAKVSRVPESPRGRPAMQGAASRLVWHLL